MANAPSVFLDPATIAPLQLALFSGKGGVGKTTLSCGFARFLSQAFPQERVLLLSTDPAHSLGDVLQVPVTAQATPLGQNRNLSVQALDAQALLQSFKARYGDTLELLLERGSFVEAADLGPVWDLNWPGLDELMGILEIQRLLREGEADRVVVDMAPSGHSLNLFALMDFLDRFLEALELFQEKHRTMQQAFGGKLTADEADRFLQNTKTDLQAGRSLLQNQTHTACFVVAIPEPMSLVESQRFVTALSELGIPWGGVLLNRIAPPRPTPTAAESDRLLEQYTLLQQFQQWLAAQEKPLWIIPLQPTEPVGLAALDQVFGQLQPAPESAVAPAPAPTSFLVPPSPPFLPDFLQQGRKLLILGGKGGVGKTTISGAIGWGFAQRYPDAQIRVISIDPAHSLGDAFGCSLGHTATSHQHQPNLSLQEIDAEIVLDQFREDYLWELADIMSGDRPEGEDTEKQGMKLLYGPQAWRTLANQSLPGIDEMLSLITIMDLLDREEQDLIILDTAPTGHLLRFLEMPTALGDWLGWIFKLWIKYQNVVGRAEFMGRLRGLRKQVVEAQKKLTDPEHTEFLAVCQNQSAIIAETQRLIQELEHRGISHRFVVENRADPEAPPEHQARFAQAFAQQTVIAVPNLPRSIAPVERLSQASTHLFGGVFT